MILLVCVALIVWVQRHAATRGAEHRPPVREEPLSQEGAFAAADPRQVPAPDRGHGDIPQLGQQLRRVPARSRAVEAPPRRLSASGGSAQAFIGAFKADYFAWFNLIGMVLQLFAVSRILRLVGVRKALLFLPVFALVAYGAAVHLPGPGGRAPGQDR